MKKVLPQYFLGKKKKENRDSNKCLYTNVHCSVIHISQQSKIVKGGNNPAVHQQMNRKTSIIYAYNLALKRCEVLI